MPRSAKDNLEIREARREEILSAAIRVFADKGFAGAKISEIAAEAGLSHGLVYHYFDSKEAILSAIVGSMICQLEADMELTHARAVDRIRHVIERRCAELAGPIDPTRLVMQAVLQGSLPDEAKAELHAHFARLSARFREWIADAQAAGDVDDAVEADQIVKVISYLMRGMSIRVQGQATLPLPLPSSAAILELLLPPPRKPHVAGACASAEDANTPKGSRSDV